MTTNRDEVIVAKARMMGKRIPPAWHVPLNAGWKAGVRFETAKEIPVERAGNVQCIDPDPFKWVYVKLQPQLTIVYSHCSKGPSANMCYRWFSVCDELFTMYVQWDMAPESCGLAFAE